MNDEQLMITTFTRAFNKYFYDELVLGKLANTEMRDNLKLGCEIDVLMPPMINLSDYTGGNLSPAEEAATATAKVKINKGKSFHFYVDEVKKQQIADAPDLKQKVELAKEYCDDAIKQFAAAVDLEYANLYANAGYVLAGANDAAITVTEQNALSILSIMQSKFQRGDGKGHNAWIDGKMVAVVPPEFQHFLRGMEQLQYVESGHKKLEKGYIGHLSGWKILVSNNIPKDANGVMYAMFGIEGKTLAGGVQKKLTVKSYEPDNNFNTNYKGYGVYGVGAPRADLLGAVKIVATPTL